MNINIVKIVKAEHNIGMEPIRLPTTKKSERRMIKAKKP